MSSARRTCPISPTITDAPMRISDALIAACAPFCVVPSPRAHRTPRTRTPDAALLDRVQHARVVQIVGPSGSGKSSLLRGIARALPAKRTRTVPESLTLGQQRAAGFDLLAGDAHDRASTLSLAGLAEPRLWARPAGALSAGEQARLRLAITIHDARAGDVVIADEFGSTLDRACAYALSRTVRRWAMRAGATLIAASAHEDLEAMLAPDLVIDARQGTARASIPPTTQPIRIEPGTRDDYRRLAHLHYRSGMPASIVRILRAVREVPASVDPCGQLLAGVLLVCMPTLNSSWRKRAWPGQFDTGEKSRDACRLNAQVRTISRVIVEPRSRGMGIATGLVRAYLQDPLTPGTEAIAAMGSICPFFERAGMTGYKIVPDAADMRLLDAMSHLSTAPELLVLTRAQPAPLLVRELTTWGKARKLLPSGTPTHQDIQRLIPIAACRLCSRPRAYAYTKGEQGDEQHDTEQIPRTAPAPA